MQIEEAHLQRLEKESGRFTNEVKQKELENEQLRCEIAKIQSQIKESKEKYDEISDVSVMPCLHSPVYDLQKIGVINGHKFVLLHFREEKLPLNKN